MRNLPTTASLTGASHREPRYALAPNPGTAGGAINHALNPNDQTRDGSPGTARRQGCIKGWDAYVGAFNCDRGSDLLVTVSTKGKVTVPPFATEAHAGAITVTENAVYPFSGVHRLLVIND